MQEFLVTFWGNVQQFHPEQAFMMQEDANLCVKSWSMAWEEIAIKKVTHSFGIVQADQPSLCNSEHPAVKSNQRRCPRNNLLGWSSKAMTAPSNFSLCQLKNARWSLNLREAGRRWGRLKIAGQNTCVNLTSPYHFIAMKASFHLSLTITSQGYRGPMRYVWSHFATC